MVTLPTDLNPNQAPSAAEMAQILTAIDALGYATSTREVLSNTTTTTAEFAVASAQFPGVIGARYFVTVRGPSESSVAGDSMKPQVRWKHTSTVDLTGTSLDFTQVYADNANHTFGNVWLIGDFVATATSTITVVVSIQRTGGTGNVKMNCTAVPCVIEVLCVDPA